MKHTSDRLKAIALISLLVHCLASTSMWAQPLSYSMDQSSLINPSFEAGSFAGYTSLDQLSLENGPPPPPPINEITTALGSQSQGLRTTKDSVPLTSSDGSFFAVVHTVRQPYWLRQSIVIQDTFKITSDATRLRVDLNFLSNEINTGPATNDTAWVYFTVRETGQVIPVAFFSRDELQSGGSGQPDPATVSKMGGFDLSTGWRTHEIELGKYVGMTGFLTFNVRKAATVLNHESQNTALAIDAIRLVTDDY